MLSTGHVGIDNPLSAHAKDLLGWMQRRGGGSSLTGRRRPRNE